MDNLSQMKSLKKVSQNLRILYVEDDSLVRETTQDIFKNLFKKVDIAVDGKEGLELYNKNFLSSGLHYDIVITDIIMPNLDGIAMSKAIHKINKNQKIIIIYAHDEKDALLDAIDIGIEGFIPKPIELNTVLETLHKLCISFHSNDLQYFKVLTEASIISKTDSNGVITYVNNNFCKITGYSRSELIGKTHRVIKHEDNDELIYKDMWDTLKSGSIWRGRITNKNKDGSDFIAESTILPLIDNNGNIIEYIGIRNDVTGFVKMKQKIFQEEQAKIKQAKIEEAKKSFLVIFTHELKTPLNAIINFSKYIKKQIISPKEINKEKLISLLDSVLNNSRDMLENITQILEISRLKAHKLTFSYSFFNVRDTISSVLNQYDSLISEKKINLVFNSDENIFINSDAYRVKQILSNIISNAIKYGNNEIIINVFKDKNTTITIEDNGEGIKDKKAIFNLYSQEDNNLLEREAKGTGIGLYYMKLLCEDLKIDYKVEDRDGINGTKFILIIDK